MVNKEHAREYWKRYYTLHRERYLQRSREYYQKNKDRCREYNRRYRETHKKEKRERAEKLKLSFIQMLGGRCQICHYHKSLVVLEFHHLNPHSKEKERESRTKGFVEKIKNGKIQLVCSNCHKELHNGDKYYGE